MSTELRIRRDSNTNLLATTPAQAEPGYDTTNQRLVVGTGAKAGGMPMPNVLDVQRQTMVAANASGTNTLTMTLNTQFDPGVYANLQRFAFKAANTNTGAVTLNINGLGARNVRKILGGVKTALAAGDLVAGVVYDVVYDGTDFQLSTKEVGIPNGYITQAMIAANTVGTSELRTSYGEVSRATGVAGYVALTLPGGAYGFYPRVRCDIPARTAEILFEANGVNNLPTSATARVTINTSGTSAGGTVTVRQDYVTSSPPYDIGDGPVPLFVFAEVGPDGALRSSYAALDPPWAYNGPTKVTPDYVSGGVKYRAISIERKFSGGDEAAIRAAALDVARGRSRLGPHADLVSVLVPIDAAWKNSDMELLPHPFAPPAPDSTIVLLDPVSVQMERMADLMLSGQSPVELLRDWMVIDNTRVNRAAPPGVAVVGCRWRNTRRT